MFANYFECITASGYGILGIKANSFALAFTITINSNHFNRTTRRKWWNFAKNQIGNTYNLCLKLGRKQAAFSKDEPRFRFTTEFLCKRKWRISHSLCTKYCGWLGSFNNSYHYNVGLLHDNWKFNKLQLPHCFSRPIKMLSRDVHYFTVSVISRRGISLLGKLRTHHSRNSFQQMPMICLLGLDSVPIRGRALL